MRGVSGFFFRFYDPKVLRDYLTIIAKCPAKLHKFFGYDTNIIYAFGSGFGDSFHYYTLKALPEDTLSAPVVMMDWEIAGFEKQSWINIKKNLSTIIQPYFIQLSLDEINKALDNTKEKGYAENEVLCYRYTVCYLTAKVNNLPFRDLESQVKQQASNDNTLFISMLWNTIEKEIS